MSQITLAKYRPNNTSHAIIVYLHIILSIRFISRFIHVAFINKINFIGMIDDSLKLLIYRKQESRMING